MKRYIYAWLGLSLMLNSSCKKNFLDVADNSNPNRQSYVKDLNSMQEFMNGIYVMLSVKYETGINGAYPGLIADELKVSTDSRPLALHNNWSQVVDNAATASNATSMNSTWQDYYLIIRSCNFVIEDVDKYASENPDKAKSIKGQAYAIRALVHFKLVNIFAQGYTFNSDASHPGVPYITTSDITKPYNRQTVAEVYNNLITDLQTSISLLPVTYSDCRFMNLSAAKALLARIYLFKDDFTNAKKLAVELVNKFPLMTIAGGYPNDLFKNKNVEQTEILFQLVPVSTTVARSNYLGTYLSINAYYATADIANILSENSNDIRMTWVSNSSGQWKVIKFPLSAAGGIVPRPANDYYVPVIRSTEMFLTAAEVSAKTNDESNARIYLNAIRKRADPTIADVTATGPALLDSIYKERRKELCFEGLRMFDLQRWKMPVRRTDVFPGYQITLPYPNDKAVAPIPGPDVKLMGLQQNPGY